MGCLGPDELLAWHVGLDQLRSMVAALVCSGLAASNVAAVDGRRTLTSTVAASTGRAPRSVRADLGVGRWLIDYPVFAEAFAAGEISDAHVRALRRAENPRTRPHLGPAQEYLSQAARSLPWADFQTVLRYWELGADPDGQEPAEQHRNRSCAHTTNADGTATGRFHLDPLAGAAFTQAMDTIVQRLWRHDQDAGSTRTTAQRRADAFIELITSGSSDPLVHIVMSEQVAEDLLHDTATATEGPGAGSREPAPCRLDPENIDGRCETINGTPLHPHWAAAILTIARFRRLIFGTDNEILEHGRRTRTFPAQLKQALLVRARGRCQEPGCDAPLAWLQADHRIPWARAGPTDAANGQILCAKQNKLKRDHAPEEGSGDD